MSILLDALYFTSGIGMVVLPAMFVPWASIPVPAWFGRWYLRTFRRVDINAMCPACGHSNGAIKHVTDGEHVVIEHLCKVCNWIWQEGTVLSVSDAIITRREIEPDEPTLTGRVPTFKGSN